MVDHSMMKLGKGAVKRDLRTLALSDFTKALTPAPDECNLTDKMTNIGMMMNDKLGDCTCATAGHIIQQWTAETGSQVILSDDQIVQLYCNVGGYVSGNPSTDNGAVELDVLKYWRQNGIAGHDLKAFASIRVNKPQELKDAVYYFGASFIGVALPISCQSQDIWDVVEGIDDNTAPGSWGGHAVPVVAYDKDYVYVITWGAIKKVTWAFFARYVDEAYALLSDDWVCKATDSCPEGFALDALLSDLAEIIEA